MELKYKKDIFISYTHADNVPFDAKDGWVDLLHERLKIRLRQLLGEDPRIWWDKKQEGQKAVAQDLTQKLSEVALLVSVMSPSYLHPESKWCKMEREKFIDCAAQDAGVDDRIFKVAKTYVPLSKQPPELAQLLGYEFYEMDTATGIPREFSHHKEGSPNYDPRYWSKLDDLAHHLKQMIEQINPRYAGQPTQTFSGKTIYLAETTSDLRDEYDRIRRELLQHHHRVLPDCPLPTDRSTRQVVMNFLAQSQLSVHLIGDSSGLVSEGEQKSIVELQYELAAGGGNTPALQQILWMPERVNPIDERQRQFIHSLLTQNKLSPTADLLQNILEKLKDNIHDKLNKLSETAPPVMTCGREGDSPPVVYLACDQPDYKAVAPIEDCLFEHGFDVISSSNQNDPQLHKENLLVCDAVLTYCGDTTDAWLQFKRTDLIKLPGYGRTRPLLAQAFYLSLPPTEVKERFRVQNGLVIKNYGRFSCDLLAPFFEQIKRAKGAQ